MNVSIEEKRIAADIVIAALNSKAFTPHPNTTDANKGKSIADLYSAILSEVAKDEIEKR